MTVDRLKRPLGGRGGDLQPPESGVTVRMYRPGLGDCFLLAFPGAADRPFYMLVDCGVLLGTEHRDRKLTEVAEHILASTEGHIDVLVITHEHYDHLSGFLAKDAYGKAMEAYKVFQKIRFDELWLAWTEDPDPANREALAIRTERQLRVRGLQAASRELSAGKQAEPLRELLGFYGEAPATAAGLGARRSLQTAEALKHAKALVRDVDRHRYWEPGRSHKPAAARGLRVYFLGPPHGPLLRTSDPTGDKDEVYGQRLAVNEERNFLIAALSNAITRENPEIQFRKIRDHLKEEREILDLSFPFTRFRRVEMDAARDQEFFNEYYGFEPLDPGDLDARPGQSWRRIGDGWLDRATDLALQLDNHTNNTSLVMAFELPKSRKVLLFPGDAQVGSWRSWHQPEPLTWSSGGDTVTIRDLLQRTVFYKVGHHGSHNATLRELGLEMMAPELVAMIPVDEEMAKKPKGGNPDGWNMPFRPLLQALGEKTGGRVIRLDEGIPEGVFREGEVDEDKNGQPGAALESRYVQYTIDDSQE